MNPLSKLEADNNQSKLSELSPTDKESSSQRFYLVKAALVAEVVKKIVLVRGYDEGKSYRITVEPSL